MLFLMLFLTILSCCRPPGHERLLAICAGGSARGWPRGGRVHSIYGLGECLVAGLRLILLTFRKASRLCGCSSSWWTAVEGLLEATVDYLAATAKAGEQEIRQALGWPLR